MNNIPKQLGMYSALFAGLFTILFGIFVVLNNQMVYFTTVLFLAIHAAVPSLHLVMAKHFLGIEAESKK